MSKWFSCWQVNHWTVDGTEMRYRYLQNNKHDCITCLRWLSKGIWYSPQIIDPGYSQPVQSAILSYQWYYPDVQWYFCLRLDGTRSDRMVQDHLWCPPRRYAITVPIHCSIRLCTEEDTTGRCWFWGLQTEWQTASRYAYRRSRIRWWYLSSGRINWWRRMFASSVWDLCWWNRSNYQLQQNQGDAPRANIRQTRPLREWRSRG